MKFLKYITIVCFAVFFAGCQDYFGEDSNVDPDNPTTVTVNVLLPQVETRLAYTYGGDYVRYAGLNTQYMDGIERQFQVLGNYGINGSDVNTVWANMYTGVLSSNRQMIALAEEGGFNHYQGIGLAIEAYSMMILTDVFGDIPYSDALKFAENAVYTPTFDSQEAIYTEIFSILGQARTLLGSDDGGNPAGSDDLIFGGLADKWIAFCNVLEARGKLHLSNRDGNYAEVIAALDKGGFTSPNDDAQFSFGATATEASPMNQFLEQRQGDTEVGTSFAAMLEGFSDPRISSIGATHSPDHPFFTQALPVKLLSYAEQEFIRAEALVGADNAAAFGALTAAVAASFAETGVSDSAEDYLTSLGLNEGTITMNDVLVQKYIGIFPSPEAWSDWRRTGVPALTPNTGTEIPRRFPYPDSELLANPNTPTPADVNIFDRVWWDM